MSSLSKKQEDSLKGVQVELLVNKYLAGDNSAFTDLKNYLQPVVFSVIFNKKYPGHTQYIEDLEQECWLEVIKSLPGWQPQRGPLKYYLFRCLANRAMKYLNFMKSTRQFVQLEEVQNILSAELKEEVRQDLDISLKTRFKSERVSYIVKEVCIAVYLKTFDSERYRITSYLQQVTGLNKRQVKFLINYALVIIRYHFWKTHNAK